MRAANPWKSYRETATLTAPPGQIVLMLFEGAIRSLERSLPGFSTSDPAEANMIIHNNLQRAQEIIRELNCALNMEQGGEFAANMRRLYDYLERRIWESNLKKNSTGVGEAIRHLTVLRDAWATMLNNQGPTAPEARPALAAA
jgi:flagellar protein FliS